MGLDMSQPSTHTRLRDKVKDKLGLDPSSSTDSRRNPNVSPNGSTVQSLRASLELIPPGQNLWFGALQTLSKAGQHRLGNIQPNHGLVSNEIDDLILETREK